MSSSYFCDLTGLVLMCLLTHLYNSVLSPVICSSHCTPLYLICCPSMSKTLFLPSRGYPKHSSLRPQVCIPFTCSWELFAAQHLQCPTSYCPVAVLLHSVSYTATFQGFCCYNKVVSVSYSILLGASNVSTTDLDTKTIGCRSLL